ncbi:hypothetical protein NQZ68_039914, partial [Dissostichus eleginoides]
MYPPWGLELVLDAGRFSPAQGKKGHGVLDCSDGLDSVLHDYIQGEVCGLSASRAWEKNIDARPSEATQGIACASEPQSHFLQVISFKLCRTTSPSIHLSQSPDSHLNLHTCSSFHSYPTDPLGRPLCLLFLLLLFVRSSHSASPSISSGLDACRDGNMAVNLGKNRLDLLTAYQDVIDETSDTDWALYTYEDESDDLKLASSGGGGLAGITLTFDSARVMYGFCSLKEPAAALPRYILINWVGDDVADARKCACASHVATIANFLQGVELTVNASSLEDIEPSAIGQRLTNGTAVVASPVLSRLKTREEDNKDVGTVYEKTNAEVEMKKINREEFWEQAK